MELNTKQMQPKHVQSPHPGTWIKRGSLQVDLNRQGLLGIELLESVITSFNLRQAKITMMMETLSCDYPTLYIYDRIALYVLQLRDFAAMHTLFVE